MKRFKLHSALIIFIFALLQSFTIDAQVTVSIDDLKVLDNTSWKGTLTYINYQDGKPVSIPTTMQLFVSDDAIESNIQYSYEPDKNENSTIKLKNNGTYFGKQKIIAYNILQDGTQKLTTSYEGKDNRKKATMFVIYEFNNESYKVTKEVQYKNSDERFMRNTYEFKKLTP
jgi:hypothetical protein